MSRCYPYRPAVSVRNGASGGALIEMIKLQREKEKSKTESLIEKRRERKERKLKEKPYDFCDEKVKKLHKEGNNRGLLVRYLSKGSEDELAEHLEKSDLTDEHEPACYLSDCIQSSKKRKRQPTPPIRPSITAHKNIIRIRLSSQKHIETDASLGQGQSCSTFERAVNSLAQAKEIRQIPDSKTMPVTNNNVGEEVGPIPDSVRKESIAQFGGETAANGNTLYENKVQSTDSFYKSMIENWVSPSFQSELNEVEVDDQDWLFGARQQPQEFKRFKAGNDVSCRQNSSTSWPSAHHLLDADIYPLPYTIPF